MLGSQMTQFDLCDIHHPTRRIGVCELKIVAINRGDGAEAVQAFVSQQGYDFPVLLGEGPGMPGCSIFESFQIPGFPTNYLLD